MRKLIGGIGLFLLSPLILVAVTLGILIGVMMGSAHLVKRVMLNREKKDRSVSY